MRTALATRHVAFEDLGNLRPMLVEEGYDIVYVEAPSDALAEHDPESADLVIVLGGLIGAYEDDVYPFLAHELYFLERRLARKRPTLGICLGAQLMARALGARVYPRHGDTFDLPDGAVHLASTDKYRNQAFSFGQHALALQFHPEVDASSLEFWYVGHACELGGTPGASVRFPRRDSEILAPRLALHAGKLWPLGSEPCAPETTWRHPSRRYRNLAEDRYGVSPGVKGLQLERYRWQHRSDRRPVPSRSGLAAAA